MNMRFLIRVTSFTMFIMLNITVCVFSEEVKQNATGLPKVVAWKTIASISEMDMLVFLKTIEQFKSKNDLTNYISIHLEKNELAYRITFISKFHEADSYGVKPGLPPDIEAFVGLSGTPTEFGISR